MRCVCPRDLQERRAYRAHLCALCQRLYRVSAFCLSAGQQLRGQKKKGLLLSSFSYLDHVVIRDAHQPSRLSARRSGAKNLLSKRTWGCSYAAIPTARYRGTVLGASAGSIKRLYADRAGEVHAVSGRGESARKTTSSMSGTPASRHRLFMGSLKRSVL
ncbi:hypothetical protein EVAR_95746_1 [Eumeta japonica]|uniref:Uncharacterized protein n=1 Tax=Eumeta variegata TaxID=151549 RepID=A0A4C1ULB9_EUMVA|nr:hypothetical protein EVAR_95746_1 [Eumeta japonica]